VWGTASVGTGVPPVQAERMLGNCVDSDFNILGWLNP